MLRAHRRRTHDDAEEEESRGSEPGALTLSGKRPRVEGTYPEHVPIPASYTLSMRAVERSQHLRKTLLQKMQLLEEKTATKYKTWSTWLMEPDDDDHRGSSDDHKGSQPELQSQKPQASFSEQMDSLSRGIQNLLTQAVKLNEAQRTLDTSRSLRIGPDALSSSSMQGASCPGMWYYRNFNDMYRYFPERSDDQQRFTEGVRPLLGPWLCGSDWQRCMHTILRESKYTRLPCIALALTPRRWGKSWCMGMLIAMLLYMCPGGIKILIFAQSVRMARKLLNLVRKFFMMLPNAASRIEGMVNNVKEFHVKLPTMAGEASGASAGRLLGASDLVNQVEACSSDAHCTFFISLFLFFSFVSLVSSCLLASPVLHCFALP